MPNPPDFDLQSAHRYFAVQCFNQAWELIEKPERTPEEEEAMIRLKASLKEGVGAVFVGYAYEALARVEKLAGDKEGTQGYLASALAQAEKTEDDEDRQMLLDDLAHLSLD